MTKHRIKISRAAKMTDLSQYPATWSAIITAMPDELFESCTARQIAIIADAMRRQHLLGQAQGYDEAQ